MKVLNRKTIDKHLFFKISNVNLCVSIVDFQSVINVDNPENKVLIYKHTRYNIKDLASILGIDVDEKSRYGITRGKDVFLTYKLLSVAAPEGIAPFNQKITVDALFKNYVLYKGDIFLQLDLDAL